MSDFDVIIIGGGPAGLAAGLYLARANYNVAVLDKESFGGKIVNVEWIENYPGYAEGVSGAQLASEMVAQATKYGAHIEFVEVSGIDVLPNGKWIRCTDGTGYSATVVIVACGAKSKSLGVPGEKDLHGKGVIECGLCDGGQFADKVLAVCGGGDAGVTEALYMSKLASKVILIEALPSLTATSVLQNRVYENPKIEVFTGMTVKKITGQNRVEEIECVESATGKKHNLKVDGVLPHIGIQPNTQFLKDSLPLDRSGNIIVNQHMETEVPNIFAAGDVRSGSPWQVATAVGDGVCAAVSAQKALGK